MRFDEKPDTNYRFTRTIFTDDVWDFIGQVEVLDPETPLCHTAKTQTARRGAWLRDGTFELGRGSFIDPSDLMLYVDDFYRYREDGTGPIEGVELVGSSHVPEGALGAGSVGELLDRLVEIDYVEPDEAQADGPMAQAGTEDDGAPGEGGTSDDAPSGSRALDAPEPADDWEPADEREPAPSNLDGKTLFQPDDASEKHGALAPRWKLMLYRAADGSGLAVIV